MNIYTSYFGKLKYIPKNFVCYSIAGKNPEWYDKSTFSNYRSCKLLAPQYVWWKEWHDKFAFKANSPESKKWYEEKYNETVLSKLNADAVVRMLSDHDTQENICLLCYETPDNFCHRQLVAKWLNDNGIKCKELEYEDTL